MPFSSTAFGFRAGSRMVDSITHNPLFLPGHRPVFVPGVMSSNVSYPVGTVIGQITTSGLLIACVKTATDGSQNPIGVMCEPIDTTANSGAFATGAAAIMNVDYCASGYFNASALVIDASWGSTIDVAWQTISPPLRVVGIFGRFPGYSG